MRHKTAQYLSSRYAHISSNRPPIKTQQIWRRTAPVDLYNLSGGVLDLDAIDSKIAQKLDDIPVKEQPRKWRARDPSVVVLREIDNNSAAKRGSIRKKISGLSTEERWRLWNRRRPTIVREDWKDLREVEGSRFASLVATATAPDLLSYALLGEPPASFTQSNAFQRKQLGSYGLLAAESTEHKLEQLAMQFLTDPEIYIRQAGLTKASQAAIQQYIRSGSSFWALHRLIATLSSSLKGCRFLVDIGEAIVYGIRRHRHPRDFPLIDEGRRNSQPLVTVSMALSLLNNLVLNIRLKGLEPGPDLCHAGLYYASKSGNIGAAKLYLDISSAYSYEPNWMVPHAMRNLQEICIKGLGFPNQWLPWKGSNALRAEVLNFISIWRGEDPPRSVTPKHIRHPAFGMHSSVKSNIHHSSLYITYLFGLGAMRLNTALRNEWQAVNADPLITNSLLHAQIFAIAFILAKDPKQALELLESVPLESITENRGETRPLLITTLQALICNHYPLYGLTASKTLRLRVEQSVRDLQQMVTPKATHMLELIEKFVILDFPSNVPHGEFKVDWKLAEGKEGLLVKFPGRMVPEYFKPVGQGLQSENV